MSLGAVILAAGRGERLGGPKALLELDGRTLAERHVERAFELGCARVVLVVRPEVARIVDASACPHAVIAISEAPDPAGSLAVGLRALASSDRVLITPVDALPATKEIASALLAALDAGAMAATPIHRARGGHPVICRSDVLAAYRPSPSTPEHASQEGADSFPPLRTVLQSIGSARVRVEMNEPLVSLDLDTPEDLRLLAGTAPHFATRVVLSQAYLHV